MHSLAALAYPTRRRIVEMLAQGQLRAGDIAKRFDMSPPAVSQHLGTLKRAQLDARPGGSTAAHLRPRSGAGFAELEQ